MDFHVVFLLNRHVNFIKYKGVYDTLNWGWMMGIKLSLTVDEKEQEGLIWRKHKPQETRRVQTLYTIMNNNFLAHFPANN